MNILKPVAAQLAAYNGRDIDAFIVNFHEDCVCEDGEGKVLLAGRAAMYDSYKQMFAASPGLFCKLVSRTVVGNYVLDEERVTGRAGNRPVPKPAFVRFASVFSLGKEAGSRHTHRYDGVLPTQSQRKISRKGGGMRFRNRSKDGESHVMAIYRVVDGVIVHVRFLR